MLVHAAGSVGGFSMDEDKVDEDEEAASQASLRLAPAVERIAAVLREKHYEERAAESDETTRSKVSKWDRCLYSPQGGRH